MTQSRVTTGRFSKGEIDRYILHCKVVFPLFLWRMRHANMARIYDLWTVHSRDNFRVHFAPAES